MSLKGKCAFVTGATGGMGFSIVEKLSEAACQVIATDMVEEEKARNKLSVIQQMSEIKYIQCDLRRKENIDELCKELDTICPEGIDILVNVAGPLYHDVRVRYIKKYYWKKPSVFKLAQLLKSENLKIMCNLGTFSFGNAVENMSIEDWNNELHINLTTPFILTKHVLPNMKQKKWGRIVYVASQLGLVAVPYASAYIASKTGLLGLAKAVALETAEFGITCNAACPGPTLTPLLQDFFLHYQNEHKATYEEAKDALRKKMPTKSYTTVSQVASFVMFLCSPGADNMTGTSVPIDGGYVAI